MDALEQATLTKVTRRLVPFLILCYLVAYLDRVNVSFAALTMNHDLGLSATAYALGSGIFFLAYFLFEVPSNLLLERFGARKWIARIMFTWGLLSGAMAFIGGETGFYIVRVLLGAAEAGFFPGIIFFLTLWYPAHYRARIVGSFMVAIPLSTVIGAPISGELLGLDGLLGLRGWQWLFLLEAAPALLLSIVVFYYLTDRPEQARWLTDEERFWLVDRLARERRQRASVGPEQVLAALLMPRVLGLSVVYFGCAGSNYGLSFFLPQIVKAFGLSNAETGFVATLPYIVGAVGIVAWGRRSDRRRERRFHTAFPLFVAAAGLAAAALTTDPVLEMIAFSVAGFGIFGCLGVFWTLPTAFLSGAAAAAAIAIVNAIGNLAGFAGPYAMGWIKDHTGSYMFGLLALSAIAFLAMAVVLRIGHDHALGPAPAPDPAE
jgi:ACS family tartrate transporter-like MFS transporter